MRRGGTSRCAGAAGVLSGGCSAGSPRTSAKGSPRSGSARSCCDGATATTGSADSTSRGRARVAAATSCCGSSRLPTRRSETTAPCWASGSGSWTATGSTSGSGSRRASTHWEPSAAELDDGVGLVAVVDPQALPVLFALDPGRPLRDAIDEAHAEPEAATSDRAPAVRAGIPRTGLSRPDRGRLPTSTIGGWPSPHSRQSCSRARSSPTAATEPARDARLAPLPDELDPRVRDAIGVPRALRPPARGLGRGRARRAPRRHDRHRVGEDARVQPAGARRARARAEEPRALPLPDEGARAGSVPDARRATGSRGCGRRSTTATRRPSSAGRSGAGRT